MSDDFDFTEDPEAANAKDDPTPRASAEAAKIEKPIKPNTFEIRFYIGHISFEADNPVQIFATIALIILSLVIVCVSFAGIFSAAGATWPEKAITVLGTAISTVVGAIVGSAVTSRAKRK